MAIRIEDGNGNGYIAAVDSNNRLLTHSYAIDAIVSESRFGNAFSVSTGFVSLTTTGSFSGLLYLYNNSETHFHVDRLVVSTTAGVVKCKIVKNPTTGTLISAGTDVVPVNLNFSSGKIFTGTVKYGADALTVTNGTDLALVAVHDSIELSATRGMIIDKANALAISLQPSASADVCVTITGYYHIV